jgi:hypothetical protein
MNTSQIYFYLDKLFEGCPMNFDVIPSDHLKLYTNRNPLFLVANSQNSKKSGEHWLAIVKVSKESPIEFFCSYGRSYRQYGLDFTNFFKRCKQKVVYNPMQFQNYATDVCGHYCIYYIARRFKNCSRSSIMSTFSKSNKSFNDMLVRKFVNVSKMEEHGCKSDKKKHNQCCTKLKRK